MKMHTRAELMAGAAAVPLHISLETKDANIGVPELKTAIDELGQTITDFRGKYDELEKEVKKGREDVITKSDVEKINKAIDDAIAGVKKQYDELEAKANRLQLGGGGDQAAEVKAAEQFAKLIQAKSFTPEQLREYKTALEAHLRNPEQKTTTLMVGVDPAGGYFVTPDKSGQMVKKAYETTPMRQLANVVTIGTDSLEGMIDNGEADAAWIGEMGTRIQTDAPQVGQWKIEVHELYAFPTVTQKLLEDATIDVEGWLTAKAVDKFARKENDAFVNGNGISKPKGILQYDTVATADATRNWGVFQHVLTGSAGSFGAATNGTDKILELIYELKAAYRQAARFLMARRTVGGVRKLKDGQGNYIHGVTLKEGALVETIFGFGVTDGEDMPAFTTDDSLAIAFGDFAEAYTIVDRLGFTVIRDNITTPGRVKFHMRKRTGGGAVNFEALKFLKFGD